MMSPTEVIAVAGTASLHRGADKLCEVALSRWSGEKNKKIKSCNYKMTVGLISLRTGTFELKINAWILSKCEILSAHCGYL